MKNVEIERRWNIDKFPEGVENYDEIVQKQKYLSIEPEVRIRKTINANGGIACTLTVKTNGGMTRGEVNIDIWESQYDALSEMIPYPEIVKRMKKYKSDDNRIIECSVVDEGTDNEFMYAEVEFPDEESAKAFVPPEWFGAEHTADPLRKMKYVWRFTRLDQPPTITKCEFRRSEKDPKMTVVHVWYDISGLENDLFSYMTELLPTMTPEMFIGKNRHDALEVPIDLSKR